MTAADIPSGLRPCFQEYDFEQLDPAQHGDLIIERTLVPVQLVVGLAGPATGPVAAPEGAYLWPH